MSTECTDCGRVPVVARSLCATCYQRARRQRQGARPALRLDDSARLVVRVPGALRAAVEAAAAREGVSLSEWVRRALEVATGGAQE